MKSVRNQRRSVYVLSLVLLCLALSACARQESQSERGASASSVYGVTLKDISGSPLVFQSYQGKIIVLDFFASWCGPCRETAPVLQSVHTEYASQADVAVVGIAMDTPSSLEAVKLFVKRYGITFPSAIDDGRIREITGVHMVPTTLILDQKGVVQARIPGARHDLKERISREIDRLRR